VVRAAGPMPVQMPMGNLTISASGFDGTETRLNSTSSCS